MSVIMLLQSYFMYTPEQVREETSLLILNI